MNQEIFDLALQVVHGLDGHTVATAESITGGAVGAAITAVPGASGIYRGGVIPYATDLKSSLLDIAPQTMASGPVSKEVAGAMAAKAALILDADYGVATTGVAGPHTQDDQPVGTVFIAVFRRGRAGLEVLSLVEEFHFESTEADPVQAREDIRTQAVISALGLLKSAI